MIYFLSCIVASKAKLEFELVKLCALFIAIFYMCRLQNESEYVICNSCKTEKALTRARQHLILYWMWSVAKWEWSYATFF